LTALEFIEKNIKAMHARNGFNKWMDETDVMIVTGLSKKSLQLKRKAGIFNYTTATGRKIKYLRSDIEKYINKYSTEPVKINRNNQLKAS
jgi:hypothetical protein